MKKKVDTTQCKLCLYRATERTRLEMGFNCVYILLMNKKRPSEPSPNCTAFKPYDPKERRELDRKEKMVW